MAEAAGLKPVQRGFDPRRGYCLQSSAVRIHDEEDPDEPDEPDQPDEPGDAAAGSRLLPTVAMPSREWEFSTHVLTLPQVADGTTLVKTLKDAGADGWELSEVVDAGDKRVLLMRRPKRGERETRRVGFAPPTHS
jgi:hypothetical protein